MSRLHAVSACQAVVVAGAPTTGSFAQGYGGLAAACAKCPYKKKLKALEKVLNK